MGFKTPEVFVNIIGITYFIPEPLLWLKPLLRQFCWLLLHLSRFGSPASKLHGPLNGWLARSWLTSVSGHLVGLAQCCSYIQLILHDVAKIQPRNMKEYPGGSVGGAAKLTIIFQQRG